MPISDQAAKLQPSSLYHGILQPQGFPGLPTDWESDWQTLPSADGVLKLFLAAHHSKRSLTDKEWNGPRGRALLIAHGLGEHGGRYLHFPHFMKDTVDSVFCLDHRGHGRSEGLRGHVDRFDQYTDDLASMIGHLEKQLKSRFEKPEIHVLGHSLGGLITLRALYLYPHLPLSSVTLSAPLFKIRFQLPAVKKVTAIALSKLWGSLHLDSEMNPCQLSHDPAVVEAYRMDRLVHSKGTPRLYTEMLAAFSDTLKRDSGLKHPIQFLVPLEDQIVDTDVTLDYFRRLKHREKTLRTYEGFYHESFNEIGKEKAFQDVKSWIRTHSRLASSLSG